MATVENKLENLDRQIQQLNLDFKLNTSKQEKVSESLSLKLREIEDQLKHVKSVPSNSAPSPIIVSEPKPAYIPSPVYSSPPPPQPSQVENDEELAKRLHEELNRPTPPPQVPAAGNYYQSPPSVPNYSGSQPGSDGLNACPLCDVKLPTKQLQEHVEFQHFRNEQRAPGQPIPVNTSGLMTMSQTLPQGATSPTNNTGEGFLSKLFGKKKEEPKPAAVPANIQGDIRVPAYPYGIQPQQQPQQMKPGAPGQPMAMVPMGASPNRPPPGYVPYYTSVTGQQLPPQQIPGQGPPGQLVYRPMPPGATPVYFQPDGTPVYAVPK
jgi:hypothetical protein